jgi:protocatechuate 3,4-dioxygenase beta subunit
MLKSRRDLLCATIGFGAAGVVKGAWAGAPPEPSPTPTPTQSIGPFYPVLRPLEADADLTLLEGHSQRAEGRVIHLTGRVLDAQGAPVPGAKIEIWQANSKGRYAHPVDRSPAPLDPNFQGFGTQLTDADGRYRFRTIKPAAYPVNPMNPVQVRAPHVHFDVTGRNSRLVTQMYFPDEPENADDLLLGRLSDVNKRALTASVSPPTAGLEPDSLLVRWDIVLVGS